ncbi:retinoic acid receptor responder protein 2-like [Pan paniscus]|uniref:retinoic acid receptor responder protein 2-like n=1 Tax=Pan paniscus TaxID=9597 RepID=UPI00156028FB
MAPQGRVGKDAAPGGAGELRGRGQGRGRGRAQGAQRRGLQVALEESTRPAVCFPETSVDRAVDRPLPTGTFVKLEFKLRQTSGRKKDWMKPECKVQPNGRKQKCLACVKLGSEDKILGWMSHCPIETQVWRESEEQQETQCSRAERAVRTHSYCFIAQVAFSKARPPAEPSTKLHGASWTTAGGDQLKTPPHRERTPPYQ